MEQRFAGLCFAGDAKLLLQCLQSAALPCATEDTIVSYPNKSLRQDMHRESSGKFFIA